MAEREIIVYVTGAVEHPGLVTLPAGARLQDALLVAELSAAADTEMLNPAQSLKDGQKIVIPVLRSEAEEEVGEAGSGGNGGTSESAASGGAAALSGDGRVDINRASAEELATIPGIGPALAGRIITYREENGGFVSTEDLQNVSGIGEKTYAKMEVYIRVN
jgi:competence protein ComEA